MSHSIVLMSVSDQSSSEVNFDNYIQIDNNKTISEVFLDTTNTNFKHKISNGLRAYTIYYHRGVL